VCVQREAMVTMGVLEHRPDLIKLSLQLMAVFARLCGTFAAETAALNAQAAGGVAGAAI